MLGHTGTYGIHLFSRSLNLLFAYISLPYVERPRMMTKSTCFCNSFANFEAQPCFIEALVLESPKAIGKTNNYNNVQYILVAND